jgi:hypothetical protein
VLTWLITHWLWLAGGALLAALAGRWWFRYRSRRRLFRKAVGIFVGAQIPIEISTPQAETVPAPAPAAPAPSEASQTDAASAVVPTGVTLDNVHFTVTAPASIPPDSTFELRFWAHLESQSQTVLERAERIQGGGVLVTSEGPFRIAQGARLSIRLALPSLEVKTSHKAFYWVGEIGLATFVIDVPPDAKIGPHFAVASVRVNGSQVARIEFLLMIQIAKREPISLPAKLITFKTAFASYATEDRDAVLARVQGIQKVLPGLDVFVDVLKLRSGEYWEQRLWQDIPAKDVFYLFWSVKAKSSPWVEKEWRCALEKKGLDFIDPVPLQSPEIAPPPPELAAKHFDDPLLAFMGR